jgi:nucleotide-binding universal stress UspA family protein
MKFLRGIECETEIRVGPAVDEISAESRDPEVDLLVIATHGRSGFKRALIGSIAEHMVLHAECPIITVPSRGRF